jgi:hypothetical protein
MTRRIVRGGCVGVGRRVVAAQGRRFPVRSLGQVVRGVPLARSRLPGEQTVRLRPQELSPGRPDPAWRRPEACLAKHRGDGRGQTSMPSFRSSPLILRYPHLGFSPPRRRIRCLIEGSSGGRPGRRDRPRRCPRRRCQCHRVRVSEPTRKLLHRSRESSLPAAARNARSAAVK